LWRRLAAALVAAAAAKVALKLLEGAWTKGVGKELPDERDVSPLSEKVIWVALAAATVAAARELTREFISPSPERV
jgi:hypothetical protein